MCECEPGRVTSMSLSWLCADRVFCLFWKMGKTITVYGFPSYVTVVTVVKFLEDWTCEGSATALKLRTGRNGSRKYAIVQFSSSYYAERVTELCNQELYYGTSYLNATELAKDVIPKPRSVMHSMEDVKVKFGCQVSLSEFCVLWEGMNASVQFGSQLRKIKQH